MQFMLGAATQPEQNWIDGIPFCEKAWVMMESRLQQPNLSGSKHVTVGGDLEININ